MDFVLQEPLAKGGGVVVRKQTQKFPVETHCRSMKPGAKRWHKSGLLLVIQQPYWAFLIPVVLSLTVLEVLVSRGHL